MAQALALWPDEALCVPPERLFLKSGLCFRLRPSGINRRFFRPVSPQAKSILLLGKSIPNCPARGGFLAGVAFYYRCGLYLDPNWARPRRRKAPKGPQKCASKRQNLGCKTPPFARF